MWTGAANGRGRLAWLSGLGRAGMGGRAGAWGGWQANTCFNELLLPPYYSKERLADCLTISIYDGGDVFALR